MTREYTPSEPQRRRMMSGGAGSAMGLFAGLGVGATLMYLFDPQLGRRRRHQLAERASEAWEQAGEQLGQTWEALSEHARTTGEQARQHAGKIGRRIAPRRMTGRFAPEDFASYAPTVAISTGAAVGALAVGALLMFFLDPQQGAQRRARFRERFNRTMDDLSSAAGQTGRRLRQKISSASSTDRQLEERIRDEVSRMLADSGAVSIQVHQGNVILSGPVGGEEMDTLLATVCAIPGVHGVDNQLTLRQQTRGAGHT